MWCRKQEICFQTVRNHFYSSGSLIVSLALKRLFTKVTSLLCIAVFIYFGVLTRYHEIVAEHDQLMNQCK